MPQIRKLLVLVLSLLGGLLLVISGTTGPVGIYVTIIEKLPLFIKDPAVLSIVNAAALILLTLSSLGGLAVISGGFVVYMKHVSTGKLLIGLGSGAGIPWLILLIVTIISTGETSTVIAQHSVTGWIGIIVSLIARTIAK